MVLLWFSYGFYAKGLAPEKSGFSTWRIIPIGGLGGLPKGFEKKHVRHVRHI